MSVAPVDQQNIQTSYLNKIIMRAPLFCRGSGHYAIDCKFGSLGMFI